MSHHGKLRQPRPDRARSLRRAMTLLPLLAALSTAGCAEAPSTERAGTPAQFYEVFDISDATLSPDGTVLAFSGLPAEPDWQTRLTHRTWFLDLGTMTVIHSTPSGWMCFLPRWGPGTSYVQKWLAPGPVEALYWTDTASRPPVLLAGDRTMPPGFSVSQEACLDPRLRWAAIEATPSSFTDGTYRMQLFALPLPTGSPVTKVWESVHYIPLLGAVQDPFDSEGALVLLISPSPTDEGAWPLELIALSCPSGTVRWRRTLDVPSTCSSSAFRPLAAYEGHQVLVAGEFTIPAPAGPKLVSRIWLVDVQRGDVRQVGEVPSDCKWIATVQQSDRRTSVFLSSAFEVWFVSDLGGDSRPEMIVACGRLAWPAGVRYHPVHGLEVYTATRHCIWRCRLKDGTVECIWGAPGDDDHPPTILAPR